MGGKGCTMDNLAETKCCKFCNNSLENVFLDLGHFPLANSYIKKECINNKESTYPLNVYVCNHCLLVQLGHCVNPAEIFSEYAYFSSYAKTWLGHANKYVEEMITNYKMTPNWHVLEIGSNDGYLLQYFKEKNFNVCGIEPAANVASVARSKGIFTKDIFFGLNTAKELKQEGICADLLIANNVLAHVPTINDFVAGISYILSQNGIATIEFPHLVALMENNQFDTIYHEHYFYFSIIALTKIFAKHNLVIFDVEKLNIHGGSLRIFVKQENNNKYPINGRVSDILLLEHQLGLAKMQTYQNFSEQVVQVKKQLLAFVCAARQAGKKIAGYGAPAKGNTLLNYCGLTAEMIDFTVDQNPHKQNCLLPGSRIPVYDVSKVMQEKPDYLLILPWNLQDEIINAMSVIRTWGGKFVIPIPELKVLT